ncbi:MAG: hypothetical protein ACHQIO_03510 [Nevskiales bacterium]
MRSSVILLAGSFLAALATAGCAPTSDVRDGSTMAPREVASSNKEAETYCQTDEDTGSRIHHTTTCESSDTHNAGQSARAMQNGGYISPKGN